MKVYKIRDRETGLFSTGTMSPSWTKMGKTWSRKASAESHLRQFVDHDYHFDDTLKHYHNAEIVEYEVVQTETAVEPVIDYFKRRVDERLDYYRDRNSSYTMQHYLKVKGAIADYERKNP